MTGAGARLTAGLQLKLTQTPLACTRVNELTKYIRKASHNTRLSHCSLIYQFKKKSRLQQVNPAAIRVTRRCHLVSHVELEKRNLGYRVELRRDLDGAVLPLHYHIS